MTAFTFRDLAFVSGRGAALLYPSYVQDYLDRVIAADVAAGNTQGLELAVTDAISTCLQALVADGILGVSGGVLAQAASLIKASCFMQGARTLSGALVPLAADMPAPTNFNFVAGDYNRRTGLLGDGSTKYLNSNRNQNSDPQNNAHISVFQSTHATRGVSRWAIGTLGASGSKGLATTPTLTYGIMNDSTFYSIADSSTQAGFWGVARSSPSSLVMRYNSISHIGSAQSTATTGNNIMIFARSGNPATATTATDFSNGRFSFYSIGEFVDLAILDARITALSNAIQAAIAP